MWCTTECWDCEDKECKNYRSKRDLYFENKKLKKDFNDLKKWLEVNDKYSKGHFKLVLEFMKILEDWKIKEAREDKK